MSRWGGAGQGDLQETRAPGIEWVAIEGAGQGELQETRAPGIPWVDGERLARENSMKLELQVQHE